MFPPPLPLLGQTGAAVTKVLLVAPVVVPLLAGPDWMPVEVEQHLAADGEEGWTRGEGRLVARNEAEVPEDGADHRGSLAQVVLPVTDQVQAGTVGLVVLLLQNCLVPPGLEPQALLDNYSSLFT